MTDIVAHIIAVLVCAGIFGCMVLVSWWITKLICPSPEDDFITRISNQFRLEGEPVPDMLKEIGEKQCPYPHTKKAVETIPQKN